MEVELSLRASALALSRQGRFLRKSGPRSVTSLLLIQVAQGLYVSGLRSRVSNSLSRPFPIYGYGLSLFLHQAEPTVRCSGKQGLGTDLFGDLSMFLFAFF